jgi:citrate lyase synthetase
MSVHKSFIAEDRDDKTYFNDTGFTLFVRQNDGETKYSMKDHRTGLFHYFSNLEKMKKKSEKPNW